MKKLDNLIDFLKQRNLLNEYRSLVNIKNASPIEGFYNAESLEGMSDETIFDEEEPSSILEYKDKFQHVSQNIFIFYFDYEDLKGEFGRRVSKMAEEEGHENSYVPIEETEMPLAVLDDMPKVKNFLQSECAKKGIDYNNIIVIFMKRIRKKLNLSHSPKFLLHDLSHIAYDLASEDKEEADEIIKEIIYKKYSEIYFKKHDDDTIKIQSDLIKHISRQIIGKIFADEKATSLFDWGNQIFAYAMSDETGYLITPDTISYVDKRMGSSISGELMLDPSCAGGECSRRIEQIIKIKCQEMIRSAEGKVFINFI